MVALQAWERGLLPTYQEEQTEEEGREKERAESRRRSLAAPTPSSRTGPAKSASARVVRPSQTSGAIARAPDPASHPRHRRRRAASARSTRRTRRNGRRRRTGRCIGVRRPKGACAGRERWDRRGRALRQSEDVPGSAHCRPLRAGRRSVRPARQYAGRRRRPNSRRSKTPPDPRRRPETHRRAIRSARTPSQARPRVAAPQRK